MRFRCSEERDNDDDDDDKTTEYEPGTDSTTAYNSTVNRKTPWLTFTPSACAAAAAADSPPSTRPTRTSTTRVLGASSNRDPIKIAEKTISRKNNNIHSPRAIIYYLHHSLPPSTSPGVRRYRYIIRPVWSSVTTCKSFNKTNHDDVST